jgi:glycosyltransferase involved in cell wall biosynthesis
MRGRVVDLQDQVQYLRAASVDREAWRWRSLLRMVARRLKWSLVDSLGYWKRKAFRRPALVQGHGVGRSSSGGESRLRVLHALVDVGLGGSSRLIVDLMENQSQVEHFVVTGQDPEIAVYGGLWGHYVPARGNDRRLRALIRRLRPNIVHVHYVADDPRVPWGEPDWRWYHWVFTAAEQEGCPVIENVNIPVPPYVSDCVNSYVYVSEFVAQTYGIRAGRERVIYPGSDTDLFVRNQNAPLAENSVGMVYRLQREKLDIHSIDPLVKALCMRPGARGYVIGGGELLSSYQDEVAKARLVDRVEFPGYVPYESLPGWFEKLAVFVAPVVRESFGQVVPFAMSMGIPVVGYRVGALPEIIGDDDLLVPVGDSDALARLIVSLLDDAEWRLRVGELNRSRAVQRFSLPAMLGAYAALYEAVVSEGAAVDGGGGDPVSGG